MYPLHDAIFGLQPPLKVVFNTVPIVVVMLFGCCCCVCVVTGVVLRLINIFIWNNPALLECNTVRKSMYKKSWDFNQAGWVSFFPFHFFFFFLFLFVWLVCFLLSEANTKMSILFYTHIPSLLFYCSSVFLLVFFFFWRHIHIYTRDW